MKINFDKYQQSAISNHKVRWSGIELLKIFAIFLIVISHIVQTLQSENLFIQYDDYILDLSVATTNFQHFILVLSGYFGVLGNSLFFICSAWFLLQSSKFNKHKWFFMFFEIWVISIIILAVTIIVSHGNISFKIIIKSLFPTTFANNWYLTCYLLFYPIHPYLNLIINRMDQTSLFRCSVVLFVLYCGFDFFKPDLFFPSPIILWITIYFVMAYIQLYMKNFAESTLNNIILLLLGLTGWISIVALTNILGLHISYFYDKVFHWASNCNPFLIVVALAMFNLMRKISYKNRIINYVASFSLLIYIVHENIVLRTYFRPALWDYVYQNYGYDQVLLWALIMSILIFMISLVISMLYDATIRGLIRKFSELLYTFVRLMCLNLEKIILKFN